MNVDVKDRSRREDLEVRKKKRMELEQKMMDYEDRLKKKRDRSAEGGEWKYGFFFVFLFALLFTLVQTIPTIIFYVRILVGVGHNNNNG